MSRVDKHSLMKGQALAPELSLIGDPLFDTVSSPNPVVRSDRQRAVAQHALLTPHRACSSFRARAVSTWQPNRAGHLHCPECAL